MKRRLVTLPAVVAVISMGAFAARADVLVTKQGSPAPERDGTAYRLIEAALSQALSGDTVRIGQGQYRETLTINQPVVLTALNPGSPAVIGDLSNNGQTALRVLTYNTHLFGTDDIPTQDFVPDWQDYARAVEIGQLVRDEGADVVNLQEVWDDGLAAVILLNAGPPYSTPGHFFFANEKEGFAKFLLKHSGLLMMSKTPLASPVQIFFDDELDTTACNVAIGGLVVASAAAVAATAAVITACALDPIFACPIALTAEASALAVEAGAILAVKSICEPVIESFSSKGYIKARLSKDGFDFIVYNTHAQAGSKPAEIAVRAGQMAQLADSMLNFQLQHPDHAIICTGDFNIWGDGWNKPPNEYDPTLIRLVGGPGRGHDAERNAPGFDRGSASWTASVENRLKKYFAEDDEESGRLDYVFFNGDLNGSLDVLPRRTEIWKPLSSSVIKGFGWNGYLESRTLSDHYGIHSVFQIDRN